MTQPVSRPSIVCMATDDSINESHKVLDDLEHKLSELLGTCDLLKLENSRLRDENALLVSERGQLLNNRDKVRIQVEAMINRLKSLESA